VSGRFHLRRRPHKVVLVAHVLASVGWFGIALLVAVGGFAAAWTSDATLSHSLRQVMETSPYLTITLGLGSLVSGAVLGLGTRFGLVRYWWVLLKQLITVAVIATDALLIPRVAHTAVTTGVAPAPLFGASVAHVVLLGVATALSIVKPKARVPWTVGDVAPPRVVDAAATAPTRPRLPVTPGVPS
jgi:hypothetical protein